MPAYDALMPRLNQTSQYARLFRQKSVKHLYYLYGKGWLLNRLVILVESELQPHYMFELECGVPHRLLRNQMIQY